MRESTFKMRERGCQMRHFRAIAQDLAALVGSPVWKIFGGCVTLVEKNRGTCGKIIIDFIAFQFPQIRVDFVGNCTG